MRLCNALIMKRTLFLRDAELIKSSVLSSQHLRLELRITVRQNSESRKQK